MHQFRIVGGRPLAGTIEVSGSKNASLPMMAASILAEGPLHLDGVPRLADVETLSLVLAELGMACVRAADGGMLLETVDAAPTRAGYPWVRKMRASFCVLGPLLARRGRAVVPLPGGCQIGPRPVDLHLKGLAALGADLSIEAGCVVASARRLRGASIDLLGPRGPTVTGTANVLCAAVLAQGETILRGAAVEPEIVDLACLLNAMGAKIAGLGTSTLRIAGVGELHGVRHRVIPDRIEAATLAMAAAVTRGGATVAGVAPHHLGETLASLRAAGCEVDVSGDRLTVAAANRLQPLDITAEPYPGIPSDLQAQWMALLSVAAGRSAVRDRVFPGRLMHVAELGRLGARIAVDHGAAVIHGVDRLRGARVTASDLRASAALVLAGLAADGETIVEEVHHLDRGYQRLDCKLQSLGAIIQRSDSAENGPPSPPYQRTVTPTCGPW